MKRIVHGDLDVIEVVMLSIPHEWSRQQRLLVGRILEDAFNARDLGMSDFYAQPKGASRKSFKLACLHIQHVFNEVIEWPTMH